MMIPFLDLGRMHRSIRPQLDDAYRRVIDSGLYIMGPELEAFECEFAAFCGVKHCIGTGNGLEALHLLLRAYNIGPGDEVLVPSNTFIATWLAVSESGATPIAIEPDIETYNIDPLLIEAHISSRTKAIIPVHLYGQPADIDSINHIAAKYGLIVIEDAAQAQGARYKARRVGSLSHAAATSFYPGKNLGAIGDGGAILTDDDYIAITARKLRNYGSEIKYMHEIKGYNSRLDELQAAFLREKLKMLDSWNSSRREIANTYSSLLKECNCLLPNVSDYSEPVWHLYVIRTQQRDHLKNYLEKQGVPCIIHYPIAPHSQPCYSKSSIGCFPVAEILAAEVLSLPVFPYMEASEVNYVCDSIKDFLA